MLREFKDKNESQACRIEISWSGNFHVHRHVLPCIVGENNLSREGCSPAVSLTFTFQAPVLAPLDTPCSRSSLESPCRRVLHFIPRV